MGTVRSQTTVGTAVLAAVSALTLAACSTTAPMVQGGDAPAAGGQGAGELSEYYEQAVDWRDCGSLECASVTVPIDYATPDGDTLDLALNRLVPAGGADRSVLVNPGGPGGSGLELVESARGYFGTDLLGGAAIVGFDPRGVGESSGIHCYSDARLDEWYTTEYDLETDDGWDAMVAAQEDYGQACLENNPELLGHVDTVSAARDLDIIRAVLGHESLDYLGFSYGTFLGATYAELFPDRVGRFVLDGAIDPALTYAEMTIGQAAGFETAYRAYLADCLEGGQCPFNGDVDRAYQRTIDLLEELADSPADTGDPKRPATDADLISAIVVALYSTQSWPLLSQAIGGLLDSGDGATIKWLSDFSLERDEDGHYPEDQGAFTAINCLDFPVTSDREEIETAAEAAVDASALFGPYLGYGELSCTTWPIEATGTRAPIAAAGTPPIVVIGTTRDPATPYAWAEALAEELESGIFLGYDGDGHTAYGNGSCIDPLVEDFLLHGTVPADGTVC
ncbi:alpha/beta fold hydrolase [Pseudactinotalea sp. HY158]|nr:alpha/beta fold hydrolase [Pseudactinotalea sp. HY158]